MEQEIVNDILNTITFKGDNHKIKEALSYIAGKTGFCNRCLGKDITVTGSGYLSNTDWEPNITGVKRMADKFDLDFSLVYDDGVELFGEVQYSSGEITIMELDDTDFNKLSYDEKTGEYNYGIESGEYLSDFFVTLLVEKGCYYNHQLWLTEMQ